MHIHVAVLHAAHPCVLVAAFTHTRKPATTPCRKAQDICGSTQKTRVQTNRTRMQKVKEAHTRDTQNTRKDHEDRRPTKNTPKTRAGTP